jgi:hypothetical protein
MHICSDIAACRKLNYSRILKKIMEDSTLDCLFPAYSKVLITGQYKNNVSASAVQIILEDGGLTQQQKQSF